MKKKLWCILLALTVAVIGAGCGDTEARVNFDTDKPWSVYEQSTYKIERFYVGDGAHKLVASGTYISTLRAGANTSTVTNDFSLTYNNEAETSTLDEYNKIMINKGLTDKYTSTVEFSNDTPSPIPAQKNTNSNAKDNYGVAQRPLNDDGIPERKDGENGISHYFELASKVKYSDPRGYSYDVDYEHNSALYRTTKASDKDNTRSYTAVEKKITLADNTRFDNEQLNYVVRALSAIKREGSATFYLASIHDSYARGEYVRHTMTVNCEKNNTTVKLALPEDSGIRFENPEHQNIEYVDGAFAVPCVSASISISSETPGPPIKMLITDSRIEAISSGGIKTKKLIAQMTFTEYSPVSAKLAYQTVYTLIGYTNSLS